MADPDNRVDIPAWMEVRLELHPLGITGLDQVIENPIGDLLMGDAAVAITVDVQLDGLELENPRTRLIEQAHHRKIRITGEGALAGEFRQFDRNLVGAPWPWVVKANQFGFRNSTFAVQRCAGLRGWNRGHVRRKPNPTVGINVRPRRGTPGRKAVTMATSAGTRLG